ncbi:hypothetical protein [Ammoniphilus sp. YIM 78166]|uniref:hypothetical protein n=1 Tax=Ammoniphilus sp. YIM 78166 TaxID=1644106 RepID=UPI00106FE462|nr:hypothetical protein [Ammoniphilus sp. YIM 78166]
MENVNIPNYLTGKRVAILGYSTGGKSFAEELRNQQISVIIGLRPVDDEWSLAEQDGFEVRTLWEAVEAADIIQVW